MIKHQQFKKLCRGRDYLAAHYTEPYSLSRAAQEACLSPYHFSRVFTEVFAESPYEFVVRLRLREAKTLLVQDNMSISDICSAVGYSSLGSFSSLFQKHLGASPKSFRRRMWQLSSQVRTFPYQSIPMCYAYHVLGRPIKKAQYSIKPTQLALGKIEATHIA